MTSLAATVSTCPIRPIICKCDVIHKTGSYSVSQHSTAWREGPSLLFRARGEAHGSTETGCGYWGSRGQPASSPPARESGERCKLPQRGPGRAPAAKRFCCILEAPDSLSCNLLGTEFGGMLLCPLEPAYAQQTRSIALTSALTRYRSHKPIVTWLSCLRPT